MQRSIQLLHRGISGAVANLKKAQARKVSRASGFALLVVIVTVAILAAVVGDFGYNARVEFEAASNARDQLRAEYLARSGIALGRLLVKVQTSVVDGLNQKMGGSDFQITEFAPYLLAAFGGGDDERKSMGEFLGVDTGNVKGLGLGKGASFEVVFGTEDGKININCGGGVPPPVQNQLQPPPNGQAAPAFGAVSQGGAVAMPTNLSYPQALYSMLMATMFSPRYNRMFENPTPDGQYVTRDEVARAIIDWSDLDEIRFDPAAVPGQSSSGGNEDYRYDALRDPYRARNYFYDTVEEVHLVKGVTDDFYGSFGSMFTVYGGCKVNLRAVSQENWPILASVIRTAAVNPNDPVLLDDTIVSALAQQMGALSLLLPSGTNSLAQWVDFMKNGAMPKPPQPIPGQPQPPPLVMPFPGLPGIVLSVPKLQQIAKTGPRRVYTIDSTGSVKRVGDKKVQVHIKAIFDVRKFKQNDPNPAPGDVNGAWVYWRME